MKANEGREPNLRPRYLPDSDPVFDEWNAVLACIRDEAEQLGMTPRTLLQAWRNRCGDAGVRGKRVRKKGASKNESE